MLPDGGTVIQNYTAGLPFPHPTNPNIADKIAVGFMVSLPSASRDQQGDQLTLDR